MYVCMYVCMYVRTYVRMHARTHMHACMHVCIYVCMYVCMHITYALDAYIRHWMGSSLVSVIDRRIFGGKPSPEPRPFVNHELRYDLQWELIQWEVVVVFSRKCSQNMACKMSRDQWMRSPLKWRASVHESSFLAVNGAIHSRDRAFTVCGDLGPLWITCFNWD